MTPAVGAQSPEALFDEATAARMYLSCSEWVPDRCTPSCGYTAPESDVVECVGDVPRIVRAVDALRARWEDVEPWLAARLRSEPDSWQLLEEAAIASLFVGRASPELASAMAASFATHPTRNAAAVLERDIAAHGVSSWILLIASVEPEQLRYEEYYRRVLQASLERGSAPPELVPLVIRRYHELLQYAPPSEVARAASERWPDIENLSERESLATVLGEIAGAHPSHVGALRAALRDDANAEMFFVFSTIRASRETAAPPGLVADYARILSGPDARRARQMSRVSLNAVSVCRLDPTRFENEREVEQIRWLILHRVGRDFGRRCEPESQRRWAAWVIAHIQRRNLLRTRLHLLEGLDHDVLLEFNELTRGLHGGNRVLALIRWCELLDDETDPQRADTAIRRVVASFERLGHDPRYRVLDCADDDQAHADSWARAFEGIASTLDHGWMEIFLVSLSNMPQHAENGARDNLVAALEERVEELSGSLTLQERAELRLGFLMFAWAAHGHMAAQLAATFEEVSRWELDDPRVREVAVNGISFPIELRPSSRRLSVEALFEEIDAALALLERPSPSLSSVVEEVKREIARWRPLVH